MSTEGPESHKKVFRDPIHGHIELHPLLVKIIDTPQFQRLRHIKQLGAKYYVYPGASHNRFEHSIGVCHLAGEMVEKLNEKQPELKITAEEVLCVKIAGLCHDLGHGPFSHVFDQCFIPTAKRRKDPDWKHEDASVEMFDYMVELESNGLKEEFKKVELGDDERQFIKELIQPKKKLPKPSSWWNKKEKLFLYEIVANDENGIDVDKWDYFERDCYYLGVPNNFDMRRTMTLARVIKVDEDVGKTHICIQDKEDFNLYQMFHTRYCLHKRACKHHVANGVELMISDALVKAHEGGYRLRFRDEKPVSLLEAIHNMTAYTRLTDHVVQDIMMSPDQNLHPAQAILEKIEKRQLYKCVVDKLVPSNFETDEDDIAKGIIEIAGSDLEDGNIEVKVVTIDYGKEKENPIKFVWFYTKENPDKATKLDKKEISPLLPVTFMEKRIRVYSTQFGNKLKEAKIKEHFDTWSEQNLGKTPPSQETTDETESNP